MKRQFAMLLLLMSFSASVFAEEIDIGGKIITIPPPEGYVRVTPAMNAVHRLSMQMSDPMNDLLAYYISESDVPVAMTGQIPSLERTFSLKVNKELKGVIAGSEDFSELKSTIKRQNREILDSVKSELSGHFDKINEQINKEFDTDLAIQVFQMVPFDPHYESDNALGYSMYVTYGVTTEQNKDNLVVSVTTTYLNTSGKVLFLYCYAPKDELEWTRSASQAWAERVLAGNSLPPSRTPGERGINWGEVIRKGIVGAMIGGVIALALTLSKKRKKEG